MKRFVCVITVICLLVPLCACGAETAESDDGKLNIVTTVFPAYDFAREIAGDNAEVTLLIPPGTEIHSYEPTPQDIVKIEKCDVLIRNGGESEEWLEKLTDGGKGGYATVTMMECVDILTEEIKEGMETEEEEGPEPDEHVWTSPVNAQKICRAIAEKLSAVDADNASVYAASCDAYCEKLAELDAQLRDIVAGASRNTLIFADRFPVRYFTEEYGLDYYAAFPGCADDAEPSAKTVMFLIDKAKEINAPAVCYIEFSNQKMADMVAEDTGCAKLQFHSCHNVTSGELESGVSYLQLMRQNVETVREALG